MGSRRKGRVVAFQALFAWDAGVATPETLLDFGWLEPERRDNLGDDVLAFAAFIVSGTLENIEAVDAKINEFAKHWDMDRIAKVDLALLRISGFSLLFQPEIPVSIVINEAVEIAKKYGGEKSFKFINGVLDGIRKSRDP